VCHIDRRLPSGRVVYRARLPVWGVNSVVGAHHFLYGSSVFPSQVMCTEPIHETGKIFKPLSCVVGIAIVLCPAGGICAFTLITNPTLVSEYTHITASPVASSYAPPPAVLLGAASVTHSGYAARASRNLGSESACPSE